MTKRLILATWVFMTVTGCNGSQNALEAVPLWPDLIRDNLHDTLSLPSPNQFSITPYGFMIGEFKSGRMVCADTGLNATMVFGSKGSGPGEMLLPGPGYWLEGRIYILDSDKLSIQVFDQNGTFDREIRTPAEHSGGQEFALDKNGFLVMGTENLKSVGLVYDPNSQKIIRFFGDKSKLINANKIDFVNVHTTPDGMILAIMKRASQIWVFDSNYELQQEIDMSNYLHVRQVREYFQNSPGIVIPISDSKFEPKTQRLYVLATDYPTSEERPLNRILQVFQWENGALSLMRTYQFQTEPDTYPSFLSFAVSSNYLFTYGGSSKSFYRYPLPGD